MSANRVGNGGGGQGLRVFTGGWVLNRQHIGGQNISLEDDILTPYFPCPTCSAKKTTPCPTFNPLFGRGTLMGPIEHHQR